MRVRVRVRACVCACVSGDELAPAQITALARVTGPALPPPWHARKLASVLLRGYAAALNTLYS